MHSQEFSKFSIDVQKIISKNKSIPDLNDVHGVFNTCSVPRPLERLDVLNKNHDANIQKLLNVTVQFQSLSCVVRTSEESRIAGGRTFCLREVSREGYSFRFVHQSGIAINLQETRSSTSAGTLHRPETNKRPRARLPISHRLALRAKQR